MSVSSPLHILYEDNHLIAVFKPMRVLTQGDKTGDSSLLEQTKEFLKQKYHKKGNVFLGLLHRLDRPVSGVVLFAKTSKAASRLSDALREREIEKTYWALVEGHPKDRHARLEATLEGKRAALSYRVLKNRGRASLLEVQLETGRKHQIRKQLSGNGTPIYGDSLYRARQRFFPGGIALVAKSLVFQHPTREEKIRITVPKTLCPITLYLETRAHSL